MCHGRLIYDSQAPFVQLTKQIVNVSFEVVNSKKSLPRFKKTNLKQSIEI